MSRRKAARPQGRSATPSAPRPVDPAQPCPCGLGAAYADCCGRFHRGEGTAPTAELLMRSRYCAFAVGDAAYLLATWHPETRPARVDMPPQLSWTRLDVLAADGGGVFHQRGTVEFRAHYREAGRPGVLEAHSTFARVGSAWFYVADT